MIEQLAMCACSNEKRSNLGEMGLDEAIGMGASIPTEHSFSYFLYIVGSLSSSHILELFTLVTLDTGQCRTVKICGSDFRKSR